MATDVVCGMNVDPRHAAAHSEVNGIDYYFCSVQCKEKFDRDPAFYVEKTA